MKQSSSLLKTAVILSAMLLVSAFVSCRSGAPWFKKAPTQEEERVVLGGSKSSGVMRGSESAPVMSGSKSAIVMSGSKSGLVLPPDPALDSSIWDLDTSLVTDSGEPSPPETSDSQPAPPPQ